MTTATEPSRAQIADRTRRLLRWVGIAAAIDFLLLVPLLYASLTDEQSLISILGPIHGIGFLIQLGLTFHGWRERLWGWWFPALVVVTLGPPGALIGHVKISRELDAALAERRGPSPSRARACTPRSRPGSCAASRRRSACASPRCFASMSRSIASRDGSA